MNNTRAIQRINDRELEMGVKGSGASWHDDFRDSAYVFIGNLDYGLTEGDIMTVFSQYGEIVDIDLIRDKATGKSKGFCFLAYEDQRSTDLAVDNFNGAQLSGRTLRVDHTRDYYKREKKKKDSDNSDDDESDDQMARSGKRRKQEGPQMRDILMRQLYGIPEPAPEANDDDDDDVSQYRRSPRGGYDGKRGRNAYS